MGRKQRPVAPKLQQQPIHSVSSSDSSSEDDTKTLQKKPSNSTVIAKTILKEDEFSHESSDAEKSRKPIPLSSQPVDQSTEQPTNDLELEKELEKDTEDKVPNENVENDVASNTKDDEEEMDLT